jgi:pyruvate,water dikinase
MSTTELRSPVDYDGGAARWTTTNAAESLPGVIDPLTWTFYFPAVERGTRAAWRDLGALTASETDIALEPESCFYGIFAGRMAMNLDRFCAMADRMPGSSAAKLEEHLFGGSTGSHSGTATTHRYPAVMLRAPAGVWRARRMMLNLSQQIGARRRAVLAAITAGVNETVARGYLREALDHVQPWNRSHVMLSMVAQGLYERIGDIAAASGCPELLGDLVKTIDGTEETHTVADVWALSRGELSEKTFLDRHGYHGHDEGRLSATVWRENPDPLRTLAARYRDLPDSQHPRYAVSRRIQAQVQARTALFDQLRPVRSRAVRPLLDMGLHFTELRELGRSTFLQILDIARASARVLGAHLTAQGSLAQPDDVFLLTIDELLRRDDDYRELAKSRRRDHLAFAASDLPQHWTGTPERIPLSTERAVDDTAELVGLPGSPGVAQGRARIVEDPEDDFETGEILICRTTDPSWAALFATTSAVVIDIGGAMSHGAIVARELGIPCVINTKNGTSRIKTGNQIHVDGGTGTVTIL